MLLFLVNVVMMLSGTVQSAPREFLDDGGTGISVADFSNRSDSDKSVEIYRLMKNIKIVVDKQGLAIVELRDVILSVVLVEVVVVVCLIFVSIFFNFRSSLFLVVLLSKVGAYIEGILRIRGLPHRLFERVLTSEGGISMTSFLKGIFNIRDFWNRPVDFLPETSEVMEMKTKTLKRGLKRKRLSSSKGGNSEGSVVYNKRGADVTLGNNNSGTDVTTVTRTENSKSFKASKFVETGARRKYQVGGNRSSRFTSEVCF